MTTTNPSKKRKNIGQQQPNVVFLLSSKVTLSSNSFSEWRKSNSNRFYWNNNNKRVEFGARKSLQGVHKHVLLVFISMKSCCAIISCRAKNYVEGAKIRLVPFRIVALPTPAIIANNHIFTEVRPQIEAACRCALLWKCQYVN